MLLLQQQQQHNDTQRAKEIQKQDAKRAQEQQQLMTALPTPSVTVNKWQNNFLIFLSKRSFISVFEIDGEKIPMLMNQSMADISLNLLFLDILIEFMSYVNPTISVQTSSY